jgi:hypothetical protein
MEGYTLKEVEITKIETGYQVDARYEEDDVEYNSAHRVWAFTALEDALAQVVDIYEPSVPTTAVTPAVPTPPVEPVVTPAPVEPTTTVEPTVTEGGEA